MLYVVWKGLMERMYVNVVQEGCIERLYGKVEQKGNGRMVCKERLMRIVLNFKHNGCFQWLKAVTWNTMDDIVELGRTANFFIKIVYTVNSFSLRYINLK